MLTNLKFYNKLNNIFKRNYCIDVHTHMYLPKYMEILKKRSDIPKVISINNENRLIILPNEEKEKTTNIGRPIGREYYDINAKLLYMKNHNISHSIISLANPWLDFLKENECESVAQELNDELESICEKSNNKVYGFATLPVKNVNACIKEINRLKQLKHIKGVILGTPGAGNGIDHINMRKVLHTIEENNLMIFLHPHYGVGNEFYNDTGHTLFLALGFPFETTVSISRLIVTGVLDEIPNLKILVAHAGAALPSLINRLDSCVEHDHLLSKKLKNLPSHYFRKLYFDAISYSDISLNSLINHLSVDDKSNNLIGANRIMFGTDNPFFPPLNVPDVCNAQWPSTNIVNNNINTLPLNIANKIKYENACKLFNIDITK